MRVLAFEDSVDIEALLVSGGVDMSKFEFKQYWNTDNYLEKIVDFSPEILMLDHYMPPTKGLNVLKGLLSSDLTRPKIIIAMSSATMANNAMIKAGANIGIEKFSIPTLEIWD